MPVQVKKYMLHLLMLNVLPYTALSQRGIKPAPVTKVISVRKILFIQMEATSGQLTQQLLDLAAQDHQGFTAEPP